LAAFDTREKAMEFIEKQKPHIKWKDFYEGYLDFEPVSFNTENIGEITAL
jgi:hypothetical protein